MRSWDGGGTEILPSVVQLKRNAFAFVSSLRTTILSFAVPRNITRDLLAECLNATNDMA
jgi:hypothetical protein